MLRTKKQSALDLTIKGSMGTFSVGHEGQSSVRVHYLQTHIGLALEGDFQERVLKKLAPVREVFPTRKLDFEQIMQRDIDDARVSTELIPYLLESGHSGLVKLFPPIIVVVLPTNADGLPADHYPKVTEENRTETVDEDQDPITRRVVRSGDVGKEVFELRQVVEENEVWEHDYAELVLNTTKSSLVIVDGQHRAMGLIALYRNLKGWPSTTMNVEPYYKYWSPNVIKTFDLTGVKLPVMFCVFPELDGPDAPLKVHEACRAIFLALNKNAKKVTKARNYLLDDRDIVSSLLRTVLTEIKELDDAASKSSLRLWNVELDSDEDKTVLTSRIAITGVTHLYGLIERLMLGNPPPAGLTPSRQNLWLKTALDRCFSRLQVTDKLPKQVQAESKRSTCDRQTVDTLVEAFGALYGRLIVRGLGEFAPYDANHRASFKLRTKLSTGPTAEFYRSIFFDGEGMNRVFADYRDGLARQLKESGLASPELKEVKSEFDERAASLSAEIKELVESRIDNLLEKVPAELRALPDVRGAVDGPGGLFADTFTTAAFQNALFLTFFGIIEQINADRTRPPASGQVLTRERVDELFTEYLTQLNGFFRPSGKDGLINLLKVMIGDLRMLPDSEGGTVLVPSANALRNILIPGELKPDEWPKFRAMLIEVWHSKDSECKKLLSALREVCRKQALERLVTRRVKEYCEQKGIHEKEVPKEAYAEIEQQSAVALAVGIEALSGKPMAAEFLLALYRNPAVAPERPAPELAASEEV